MLKFVRSTVSKFAEPDVSFLVPETHYDLYDLGPFDESQFLTDGVLDSIKVSQAADDPRYDTEWQMGISRLQSRLDILDPYHYRKYESNITDAMLPPKPKLPFREESEPPPPPPANVEQPVDDEPAPQSPVHAVHSESSTPSIAPSTPPSSFESQPAFHAEAIEIDEPAAEVSSAYNYPPLPSVHDGFPHFPPFGFKPVAAEFPPPPASAFEPAFPFPTESSQHFNSVESDFHHTVNNQVMYQVAQPDLAMTTEDDAMNLDSVTEYADMTIANDLCHQTQPQASTPSFSFSATAPTPAPAPSNSFNFGDSNSAASNKPEAQSSPFKGFGSTDPVAAPTASTFGFGGSATPSQNTPAASPFKFSSTTNTTESPAKAPAPSFNFGAAAEKTESPAKVPTSSFNFGAAAEKTESPAKAPTPSFNFGGAAASPQKSDSAPATSAFNFAPQGAPKDDSTTTPSKPAFSFGAAASPVPASPKPAEQQLPSFSFGASASAPKPADEVSYPQLNSAASSQPETAATGAPASPFKFIPTTSTPAASSPSAFKPTSSSASESPKPQNAGLGSSMFSSTPAQQKPAESAFKGFGASASNTTQPSAPTASFGFGSSVTAQAPAPPGSSTKASQAVEQTAFAGSSALSGVATPPASPHLSPSESNSASLKQLNEALRVHLASMDQSQDWSSAMRYYLDRVADIRKNTSTAPSVASASSTAAPRLAEPASVPSNSRGEKRPADEAITKDDDAGKRSKISFSASTTPTKPLSTTASLFDDILNAGDKPQTPQQTNAFSANANKTPAPPATAPPAKSNPFATIARPVSATPGPSFAPPAGAAVQATGSPFQIKPNNPPAASSAASSGSPFQIKPTTTAAPAAASASAPSGFQLPKFGGAGGAPTNFLSSFGKQAAAEEEKEREKRKAEDMDSDEDEEEWEKRDAEEQAKKKAELQSASQSLKFSFDSSKKADNSASAVFSFGSNSSTTSTTPASGSNIFGHLSGSQAADDANDGDTDEDEDVHDALNQASPAKPAAGKSLFERVSFDADTDKSSAPGTPGASFKFSSFGNSNNATSPAGDKTWKENTPIKFGTSTTGTTTPDGSPAKAAGASVFGSSAAPAATPKFNFGGAEQATSSGEKPSAFTGMFGAKPSDSPKPAASTSIFDTAKSSSDVGFKFGSPGATGSSGLAPPSGSSVFASAATSRATTPGATTTDAEGSAAESEPSDNPNDVQKDLTSLTSEEISANNLTYEARCKAMKFVKGSTPPWQSEGVGPIRILTAKDTGKPRVLMRADPSGKVKLNFNVVLNKDLYTHKGGKMAQVTVPGEDKKMETYMCTFKDETKAKEFVQAMQDAITNAQA